MKTPLVWVHVSAAVQVLQQEDDLNEIVQLVGKDALAETDKVVLETARLIKEDYLQQNSFTSYDKYCPFYKSVGMLKNIIDFHTRATDLIEKTSSNAGDGRVTFDMIKRRMGGVIYKLASQKFIEVSDGEESVRRSLQEVSDEVERAFRDLESANFESMR